MRSYIEFMDGASVSKERHDAILSAACRPRAAVIILKRAALAAALIALAVFLAAPALAAGAPGFYELLYKVSPRTAQFFMPVELSDVKNGIELKLEAVYIRDSKIDALFSLRDLTENRIDAGINLAEGCWVNSAGSAVLDDELVHCDAESGWAAFMLTFSGSEAEELKGEKITLGVDGFYSGARSKAPERTNLKLADYSADAKTARLAVDGWTAGDDSVEVTLNPDGARASAEAETLAAFETPLFTASEGFEVTAAGYVDGLFTVQTRVAAGRQGYLLIELLDGKGEPVGFKFAKNFRIPAGAPATEGERYDEYSFEIPKEEIGGYSLSVGFADLGEWVSGPWRITFPLKSAGE